MHTQQNKTGKKAQNTALFANTRTATLSAANTTSFRPAHPRPANTGLPKPRRRPSSRTWLREPRPRAPAPERSAGRPVRRHRDQTCTVARGSGPSASREAESAHRRPQPGLRDVPALTAPPALWDDREGAGAPSTLRGLRCRASPRDAPRGPEPPGLCSRVPPRTGDGPGPRTRLGPPALPQTPGSHRTRVPGAPGSSPSIFTCVTWRRFRKAPAA